MAVATDKARKPSRVLEDVCSFAEVGLGLKLYDWQLETNLTIDEGSRYERIKCALVAPNGSGKTQRIVAVSALRWLNRHPLGRVIITSADGKQIDSQLMVALREHRAKFPAWDFQSRMVKRPEGGFIMAFTTDEPSKAEGHHASLKSPLLIIIDEAKSVDEEIFKAFDRCTFNVALYISSPGVKAGRFFGAFTEHREQFVLLKQVGLTDCPHISEERIKDVKETYGENSEYTRSTLYGEFMSGEEDQMMVFDIQELQHTLRNPPHAKISRHEYAAFCDFAAGRDENVLAIRSGNKLLDLVYWHEKNTVSAVGRFILEFKRHGLRSSQIWGDNGGIGHAFCDLLGELGWPIGRFDFGAHASRDLNFVSRGAEIWVNFAQRIARHEIVLVNDPTLISQLATRRFEYDMKGRIRLEDKEQMAARGLHSPDRADAVIGAFAHGSQSFAQFVQKVATEDPFGHLDRYYEGLDRGDLQRDRGDEQLQRNLGGWAGE